MKLSCYITSKHIQELLKAFFKYENAVYNGEQKKKYLCEDGIEKSVPLDCHLSSRGFDKPHDAKRRSS